MNWISVKDRLPEKGQYIIVWENQYETWASAFFVSDSFNSSEDYTTITDVTHWARVESPKKES